MEIKEILRDLREKKGLTQDALAEKVLVTRQAVSRWETGETQPNTDTLKLLSREFDVSINTLLGAPRQLVCQCCGMPLSEDGDGKYVYGTMDALLDFITPRMAQQFGGTPDALRPQIASQLKELKHWKNA